MKTIYNGSDAKIILYWKIMRGENKVTEDLSNLKSRVFLIGSCNTYSMEPDVVTDEEFGNKVLKVEVDASMLSTGVYDVKAVWEKNDSRNIMKSARTGVFAITDNSEEVGEIKSEEVIRIVSYVESIGRDGLSAYEIAVIRGLNNGLSENDWVGNEAGRIIAEQGRVEAEETREENETKRKDAEDDRRDAFETFMSTSATDFANAQRDRKSAFDAAQEDRETTFEDKLGDFDERFSEAEAKRNDGEATRNNNYAAAEDERDAYYATAEANRNKKYNQAEAERDSTIQGKLDDIEDRFTTAEDARKSTFNTNENNRQANEEKRIQAEGDRKKNFEDNEGRREQTFQDNEARRENTFLGNEDTREQNEQIRQAQESVRQQAEQIRIDTFDENERGRIATFNTNEAARIAAENERKQNEVQREANEAIRQEIYKYENNSEFVRVILDSEGKVLVGIQQDGNIYIGAGVPHSIKQYIEREFAEIPLKDINSTISFVDNLHYEGTLRELLEKKADGTYEMNNEFVKVCTDSEGKILSYIRRDGSSYIHNLHSETIRAKQDSEKGKGLIQIEVADILSADSSIEDWEELTTDQDGKIISYRNKKGVKVENVGLDVKSLVVRDFQSLRKSMNLPNHKQNLPQYGYINIKAEKFYLTYDERYVNKDDVVLIQTEEDSIVNATNKVTLSYFYIKSTVTPINGVYNKQSIENSSVRLTFYAASEVSQVDGKFYVTGSLNDSAVSSGSIRVTEIVDIPPYKAWKVDKSTEHFCLVDVDFGDFLRGNDFAVGVKYQGSSTLAYRKRNWRFTFYKDATYEKKNKIKIGEMVRVSGFNLKAGYTDSTRVKEYYMNLVFMSMWDKRQIPFRYPWDVTRNPYTGATGMIKGFPCRVDIGGNFYGIHIFGLKKDKANYCIDSDADGILVGGTRGGYADRTNWIEAKWEDWEDEVNDEMSESNKEALTSFFSFINSEEFTKENMAERMSIVDWIDYFIGLQVFLMKDNTCRNMMLYSDKDKRKFYPFFYDLDLSWNFGYTNLEQDILIPANVDGNGGVSFAGDMSLWEKFTNAYWDEICNRYAELRSTIFTDINLKEHFDNIYIPTSDMVLEKAKWGEGDIKGMNRLIALLLKRLNWLDIYFK